MSGDAPFMAWIDHLPEVGDPIRRERARLLELAQEAASLERHALALRHQVVAARDALTQRVLKHWTLADVQKAVERAEHLDLMATIRGRVDDDALRRQLQTLDGWQLATEALQVFDQARVIRHHGLLSSASDEERRQTLARVLDWWNHAARPVCERLDVR